MTTTLLQPKTQDYQYNEFITLESGHTLSGVTIRYTTYGKLNKAQSNVVWIFHALTGNSNPMDWWTGIFGSDAVFDPEKHFIICANALGSCYGTAGNEEDLSEWVTIRDMVAVHQKLRDFLGIKQVHTGIGGSLGGQQLLEWAVQEPHFFKNIVPIATNAVHSPWGIAFNEAQRMALENIDKGKGLEAARAIAMLSYRSYQAFDHLQKDNDLRRDHFSAASYQRYQGEKLRKRFTTEAYYSLSKAMDSHNVGRNGDTIKVALGRIQSRTLVIGVNTDILFPLSEQQQIAESIPGAKLEIITSLYGHDAFLIEYEQLNNLLKSFLYAN